MDWNDPKELADYCYTIDEPDMAEEIKQLAEQIERVREYAERMRVDPVAQGILTILENK